MPDCERVKSINTVTRKGSFPEGILRHSQVFDGEDLDVIYYTCL